MTSTPTIVVQNFLEFLQKSPSPFHAVKECQNLLSKSGFQKLDEKVSWEPILKAGGRYFFQRNGSTIVAFTLGTKYQAGQGFYVIGAHTDSPCLKVRPKPCKSKEGYGLVGVGLYGGGLWHTWFDRDLGVAGKVVVQDSKGAAISEHLVNIGTPLLRVPSLALHLDRTINEGFKFNVEGQLLPILCLHSQSSDTPSDASHHSQQLLDALSQSAGFSNDVKITDMDLCLYDIQPPSVGGVNGEFVFGARLDNLLMSYCAIHALVASCGQHEEGVQMVALFDNEEVGSQSMQGADSNLLASTMKRILQNPSLFDVAIHHSFLVSADVAHAVHPNYSDKHEELHRPKINQGMVIKTNFNQRYATSAHSSALFKQCAQRAGQNIQEFVVRNDAVCGSTIGPILASRTGIRVVDIGLPVLSMHSIREMGGVSDVVSGIAVLKAFFEHFSSINKACKTL